MSDRRPRRRTLLITGGVIAILLVSAAVWYALIGRRTIGIERSVCYECFWKYQPPAFESALIEMYSSFPCTDDLCRAETAFLVGNVIPDKTRIVKSVELYKSALKSESHPTRRMLAALALAMAGGRGGIDERPYQRAAADLSYTAGRKATGDLLMRMREGNPPPRFGDAPIRRKLSIPAGANAMILGTSSIVVPPGAVVSVQLERTFRDWLSYQLYFDFREPSLTRERVLNYHEGARLRDLMQIIPLRPAPALATILAVRDGTWYAPDEGGTYRFPVNEDLLWYPTTKRRGHYALMTDTQGISAMVEQAVASRAYLAIGSGDSAGSAQAAFHLAQRGIHIYMPGDRFIGDLLGYEGRGIVLGAAPIHFAEGRALIGQQPVTIRFQERVVVGDAPSEDTGNPHDGPARYFRALTALGVPLEIRYMPVRDGQVAGIIAEAARLGATVIAVRVAHQDDYAAVKQWLAGAPERRVVLFHSAPYPTGYRLFAEFPLQVTFGDPRPRFETL